MQYSDTSLCEKAAIIKTALEKAEAVIIGAGSGISSAAGLSYDDANFFNTAFPGYHEHYGPCTINEADFFQFPTPEEQYAYWTRLISEIRYNYPVGKPYLDLYRIINDKPYFVITTNTDGQFFKAGFPPEKICAPQGDLAYFQCSNAIAADNGAPCNEILYPNEQMIQTMAAALPAVPLTSSLLPVTCYLLPKNSIPRCPNCGSPLAPNVRGTAAFVDKPWTAQYEALNTFLFSNRGKNMVLLELGVGVNTPGFIRYPFELKTLERKNTTLIRINLKTTNLTLVSNNPNTIIIPADIGHILAELAKEY